MLSVHKVLNVLKTVPFRYDANSVILFNIFR